MLRSRNVFSLAAVVLAILAFFVRDASAADPVLVFAAASLKNALDDADAAYEKATGTKVAASYAASGPLAKQIENAAPADLFISADLQWMDYLADRNLIKAATRANLLGNTLVLVAPKDSTVTVTLTPGLDLARLLGDGRLALGDPQSVPAGKYAQAALASLGAWPGVQGHLALADSVRAALVYVSRGETPLGIVYATDAKADPGVRVVATFPEGSHPPIIYPAAVTTTSHNPDAEKFLLWLESPGAAQYFEKQGFVVLK